MKPCDGVTVGRTRRLYWLALALASPGAVLSGCMASGQTRASMKSDDSGEHVPAGTILSIGATRQLLFDDSVIDVALTNATRQFHLSAQPPVQRLKLRGFYASRFPQPPNGTGHFHLAQWIPRQKSLPVPVKSPD